MPAQKVDAIDQARRTLGPVAMVGDGINDAPALSASDVGIFALRRSSPVSRSSGRSRGRSSPMIELPLVFLGGLLGSAHCVGMCGGFAVSIGLGSQGLGSNLCRQFVYTAGRIFTYSFFGVAAGHAGIWIAGKTSMWINMQATLSIMAGLLLIAQSSLSLGLVPRRYWPKLAGSGPVCLAGTFVGPFLTSPNLVHALIAGVLTGFLPCGLVYGYLALASSSANIWSGLLTMSAFGAGQAR